MTLVLALLLDAALGEPRWLWSRLTHPAILMGRAVDRLDTRLNHAPRQRARGIAATALLAAGALAVGALLAALPGGFAEVLVGAVLLAQRSLVDHVAAVAAALRLSTADGRIAVGRIVGRDTAGMDDPAIARAAIESAAENFSDGVVAPAFWFALGGLPGLLLYKVVNTADSMIGYRTPRHAAFGWAAARLDDVLNWVPARLSVGLLWLATGAPRGWHGLVADARRHRSPNAGWPEAAMARALDVALSGPRSYHGSMKELPFVNETGNKTPGPAGIDRAVTILWRAWGVLLIAAIFLATCPST